LIVNTVAYKNGINNWLSLGIKSVVQPYNASIGAYFYISGGGANVFALQILRMAFKVKFSKLVTRRSQQPPIRAPHMLCRHCLVTFAAYPQFKTDDIAYYVISN
jgi:hypothetical protein